MPKFHLSIHIGVRSMIFCYFLLGWCISTTFFENPWIFDILRLKWYPFYVFCRCRTISVFSPRDTVFGNYKIFPSQIFHKYLQQPAAQTSEKIWLFVWVLWLSRRRNVDFPKICNFSLVLLKNFKIVYRSRKSRVQIFLSIFWWQSSPTSTTPFFLACWCRTAAKIDIFLQKKWRYPFFFCKVEKVTLSLFFFALLICFHLDIEHCSVTKA